MKGYIPDKLPGKRVSALMLERYRLGEVSARERKLVETELATDESLRFRYEALDGSDRELRAQLRMQLQRYPWEQARLRSASGAAGSQGTASGSLAPRRFPRMNPFPAVKRLWVLCAAALALLVLFPSVYLLRGRTLGETGGISNSGTDRLKGMEAKTELSIYLKENVPHTPADEGRMLPDSTLLSEGNTVQLAYLTPPAEIYYGVIFSIDGRSVVTLHYPYSRRQNPVLTAGKKTFLNEAYTLDDAPDFEIFFMVVSKNPLDTDSVLKTAGELAKEPETALARSVAAFMGCEVETITIRK